MNIMFDIETTGTIPGCCILSVAAVPFGQETDIDPFYMKISLDSCEEAGLKSNPDTMKWWQQQSEEARAEAFSGKLRLETVLQSLTSYLEQFAGVHVWGNGASFDAPILTAAFKICKMKTPWKYTNERCYRTLAALCKEIPKEKPTVAHNALADATAQANHAARILNWFGKRVI